MGVVHERRAMRRPARVGNAGAALEMLGRDVGAELGDAGRASGAPQAPVLMQRHAAGVVAAVFEAAQALDQNRDDVARTDRADDSTHALLLSIAPDSRPRQLQLNC